MLKVGIFTKSKLNNAYSCIVYLKRVLSKQYQVYLWAENKTYLFDNIQDRKNSFSFSDFWLNSIRIIRYLFCLLIFFIEVRKYDVIIFHELTFFYISYYLKKIYSNKIFIHYNTELDGNDIRYPFYEIKPYEKHASFPDFIIECLKERAEYRKKTYHIDKPIYVINNTLPLEEIKKSQERLYDVSKYFTFKKKLPVLIYAGGCNLSRSLGDIISCCSDFKEKVNFLFFCYGNDKDYSDVEKLCKQHENCRIFHSIQRNELLQVMSKCDIGIQYYDPKFSVNHKYAAPSKFFEYMAAGLNILSSNNEGINNIIINNNLGICLKNNETIKDGLNRLLNKGLEKKYKIQRIFEEKYCYEKDSENTIYMLNSLIDSVNKVKIK